MNQALWTNDRHTYVMKDNQSVGDGPGAGPTSSARAFSQADCQLLHDDQVQTSMPGNCALSSADARLTLH